VGSVRKDLVDGEGPVRHLYSSIKQQKGEGSSFCTEADKKI
jgi:hypothetical protein